MEKHRRENTLEKNRAAEGSGEERNAYTGLDYFRLAAAFLVIAIHTSPLESFSVTGDFILTRVIGRIAVPFFFMTSGFFLSLGHEKNTEKLREFVKRTAVIYGWAILLYLPVNCYNHYFEKDFLAPRLLQDLVFEGTFYHLWYLPAAIAGACIAWFLARRRTLQKALLWAALLYLIGLFGDSYYGWSEKIPLLKGMYDLIFQLSDRTRNGVFFAPVFFLLGGYFANCRHGFFLGKNLTAFLISLAMMTAEALFLRAHSMQRHDSMYLFLVPCMYFLFAVILQFRGRRPKGVRTLALTVYLIHPLMIVVLRGIAKIFRAQDRLLENSAVYYILVSILSLIVGILLTVFQEKWKTGRKQNPHAPERAFLEINLANLRNNVRVLKGELAQGCELMAVVKAGGYGHGAYEIAVNLDRFGVGAFAVATIEEGIRLRKYGIRGEILILGYTDVSRAPELRKYDLMQTLISCEYAALLNAQKTAVKVHIKIDTGMHRLGADSGEILKIEKIFDMKYLRVTGIYTHLGCAESLRPEDIAFTKEQIRRFDFLLEELKKDGIRLPKIHMQSSYGLLNYPGLACDYVRTGIALYGVPTSLGDQTVLEPDLRPVLSLKSRIALIRTVRAGESIGYDRGYTVLRDSRIAVLSIGYGDGFPRALSAVGDLRADNCVMIRGKYAPIVGKICMDQMTVDVTDIEEARAGDEVLLIGQDTKGLLGAAAVADRAGSISNELLCRMGARLCIKTIDRADSLCYHKRVLGE